LIKQNINFGSKYDHGKMLNRSFIID